MTLGALAVGVAALAAGVGLLVVPAPAPPDAGPRPAATAAGPARLAVATQLPEPSGSAPTPDTPPDTAPPAGGSVPDRLHIPHLRISAVVDPAGVGRGGRLGVPADPDRLGWWIGGAVPGAGRGTVLIAGHVDTADAGRGVLFRLEELPMGARVEVEAAGQRLAYRVTARRSYAKQRLPGDLFAVDTPHRLALVTCGGEFRDGGYARNVVVYAEPAG